jgi:glutamyl-Q tRNA(Asp) synthetase
MPAASTLSVFRFAPSPNGYLHLGHAYSALLNFDLARRAHGQFLLRIEDIDLGRCRREYDLAICEDLAWLGIRWQRPVRRQSEHFSEYRSTLDRLNQRGLLYPCFCTRREIIDAPRASSIRSSDPDGSLIYPGTCRHLSASARRRRIEAGESYALRIDIDQAIAHVTDLAWSEVDEQGCTRRIGFDPRQWGDVVVMRKDIPTTYHLAVVVDDATQGVTDVVRGQDLFAATSIHRILQDLLGLNAPRYRHHRLIYDSDDQKKLAKRRASQPLRRLRAQGVRAADIRRQLGFGDWRD